MTSGAKSMRVFNVSCAEDCEPAVSDLKVPVSRFSCSGLIGLPALSNRCLQELLRLRRSGAWS